MGVFREGRGLSQLGEGNALEAMTSRGACPVSGRVAEALCADLEDAGLVNEET
jgi:hypothetical protein